MMEEHEYAKHEKDYIKKYQKQGYDVNFRFENGKLIASKSKNLYGPTEVSIVAEHRYEGMSNPLICPYSMFWKRIKARKAHS